MRYFRHFSPIIITVTFFCTVISAQTPHSLDSVVQVIPANQFSNKITNSDATKVTKINSAQDAQDILDLISDLKTIRNDVTNCNQDTALILHTASWHVTASTPPGAENSYSLLASQFTAFSLKGISEGKCKLKQDFGSNYQPLIYNKKSVYFIGINYFDSPVDKTAISITYKLSESPTTPQNIQDLGTLVAALAGVTLPSSMGPGAPPKKIESYQVFVAQMLVQSTAPPPYNLSVTYGLQPATSQLPNAPVGTPYRTSFVGRLGAGIVAVTDVKPIPDQNGNTPPLASLGLSFDPDGQTLSGVPKAFGTAKLKVTLKHTPKKFSISNSKSESANPTASQLPSAPVNVPYQKNLAGVLGSGIVVTDVKAQRPDETGNLKDVDLNELGLSFNPDSQTLSGVPKAFGTAALNLTGTQQKGFTISNNPAAVQGPNTGKGGQQQNTNQNTPVVGQPVDCSNTVSATPCTFTDTFNVTDREYWDVSLGLAIPGVKETVYKPSSSSGKPPSGSTTTHTDAYAFVDYYFLAKYANKIAPVPHINGGIPITSQPLHRPYLGMAWDISGWAQKHGLPIDLNVFGGVVFMKQQIPMAGNSNQLKTDWARKGLWGIEVPISGIASKLSPKSSNKGGNKGGGQ